MQYRLYVTADRNKFCDPDKILLGVRDFLELNGEGEEKTVQRIRGFYPYAVFESEGVRASTGKRATVYLRGGRNDRSVKELEAIVALQKPKNPITVSQGKEFFFKDTASGKQVARFLGDNVNPYDYADEYLPAPPEKKVPKDAQQIEKFCTALYGELIELKERLGIKMSMDDLMCVQNYFISESREPTYTELKVIDSFFSESFRHTTFETVLDDVISDSPEVRSAWQKYRSKRKGKKPSLSDLTVTAAEELATDEVVKASKKLTGIRVKTKSGDRNDDLLLFVKSESHNRSVTAVPYDGAAGAIGCAVKDVFCAFGNAYDAYRVVGRGKTELNRKNALLSTAGFAETASQIGLPCSKCNETVSDLYTDKQLEVCTVLALSKLRKNDALLKREPMNGNKIYLIGSATGADGVNSAHSSLKSVDSVGEYIPVTDGGTLVAMQRLFLREDLANLAVAINDIGSGGIVCAIGEMVGGAEINLSAVPLRHEGLSCADIVLSESNERMLVCVRRENSAMLETSCKTEGLSCSCIATVTDDGRFTVIDRQGNKIVSLQREFLLNGGAEKHLTAKIEKPQPIPENEAYTVAKAPYEGLGTLKKLVGGKSAYDFEMGYIRSAAQAAPIRSELSQAYNLAADASTSDVEGALGERDYSVRYLRTEGNRVRGARGKYLSTAFASATLPEISKLDPYRGAYLSVVEAYLKLVAAGCADEKIYLSIQEYFPEHKNSSVRLGVSVASMLGAFEAQSDLGVFSIGGRVTMGSGSKVSEAAASVAVFAFAVCDRNNLIPSAFSSAQNKVIMISPGSETDVNAIKGVVASVNALRKRGAVRSMRCVNAKNVCTALIEMCRCGSMGVCLDLDLTPEQLFRDSYCSIILEVSPDAALPENARLIGTVTEDGCLTRGKEKFSVVGMGMAGVRRFRDTPRKEYLDIRKNPEKGHRPRPAFGDKIRVLALDTGFTVSSERVKALFAKCGADVRTFYMQKESLTELVRALKKTDIFWLPDTLGDSAYTAAILSDKKVREELDALIGRKGLIYGCGSSFEALITSEIIGIDKMKVSFVRDKTENVNSPVSVRVANVNTPFMLKATLDGVYPAYVTGNRLRMLVAEEYADELGREGRIITQYAQGSNAPRSTFGIDALSSSDGHVLGQLSTALCSADALPIVKSTIAYFAALATNEGEMNEQEQ